MRSLSIPRFRAYLGASKQVFGRVDREVRARVTRMRRTAATASLIKQYDPVGAGIEEATYSGRTPRAGTAVEDDSVFVVRIAAGLPVHKVPVADIEHAMVVRFDFWVEHCHT